MRLRGFSLTICTQYTHGHMDELIDIVIEEKAALFVVAVGVPTPQIVEKLHAAGIPIMNMVGAPKHVDKAIAAGADLICCQGTEGGGHTGEIGTLTLIPQCVERCKGHKSPLTGEPIYVVGAGGIVNGQSMAAAFTLGAEAVWVGTRFVASEESTASDYHKALLCEAGALDTTRTLVFSGRPLRCYRSNYVAGWEKKEEQVKQLCEDGVVPFYHDLQQAEESEEPFNLADAFPKLFGQGCGLISKVQPAGEIVDEMMRECIAALRAAPSRVSNSTSASQVRPAKL